MGATAWNGDGRAEMNVRFSRRPKLPEPATGAREVAQIDRREARPGHLVESSFATGLLLARGPGWAAEPFQATARKSRSQPRQIISSRAEPGLTAHCRAESGSRNGSQREGPDPPFADAVFNRAII